MNAGLRGSRGRGDVPVERRIRRPIDYAHAAGADLADDFVRSQPGTRRKLHSQSPGSGTVSRLNRAMILLQRFRRGFYLRQLWSMKRTSLGPKKT